MKCVEVTVNGKLESLSAPVTIAQFIESAGWKASQVVVEHNGIVLPRQRLTTIDLADGDRLEVVVPVAGG